MKKTATKASRAKGGRRSKAEGGDSDWHQLEAQADRLKYDWMSLSVQLGIGGGDERGY